MLVGDNGKGDTVLDPDGGGKKPRPGKLGEGAPDRSPPDPILGRPPVLDSPENTVTNDGGRFDSGSPVDSTSKAVPDEETDDKLSCLARPVAPFSA